MYSSLSVSKCLVLTPILAMMTTQLLLIRSVSSLNMSNAYLHHNCYVAQGKYKPGSEYEKELTHITHTISSTSNLTKGYEMISLTGANNNVSVILQCRGDSYGPKCRSCYATALSGLRKKCPKYKGGIIWYDQCLLEYSGINTVFQIDYDNNFCMSNPKNVSKDMDYQDSFSMKWNIFISNLTTIAMKKGYSNPTPLYAVGERSYGTNKMYGMVQCTGDVSIKGCQECIVHQLVGFQECMRASRGARVLGRSCNLRFEFYPFVPNSSKI